MVGSTNFLVFNPGQVNMETDAQYAADSQRTGGAPNGTPFPSRTGNKLFYQASSGVAALMQMMANKGFNCTDTNYGTLTGVLAAIQTTADMKSPLVVVPFSPSANFNAGVANGFQITLTGNALTCTIANWSPGQILTFIVIQDSAGGHFINIPGVNLWQGAANLVPNGVSLFQIMGRADGSLWSLNQELLTFNPVQQGTGIGQTGTTSNNIKIGWTTTRLAATVDTTNLGNFIFDSQLSPVSAAATAAAAAAAVAQTSANGAQTSANTAQGTANAVTTAFNTLKSFLTGSMAGNGWIQIPLNSGHNAILQWGSSGDFDPTGTISFPVVYPNACLFAMGTDHYGGSSRIVSTVGFNTSSATFQKDGTGNGIFWFAIGF